MRRSLFLAAVIALCTSGAAHAETPLEEGFVGALRGCEEWILNPKSWAGGPAPFVATVGLGQAMGLVSQVDDTSLPPKPLRAGNHYWRINSTPGAGYILVVSDQLPMCHITGGGDTDLQPIVEAVLGAPSFATRWKKRSEQNQAEMVTTVFKNVEDPAFSITISRARTAGQRLDRVQVIATATYSTAK